MTVRPDPPAWRCQHCQVFTAAPNWLSVPDRSGRRCPACGAVVALADLTTRLRLSRDAVRWLPRPLDA